MARAFHEAHLLSQQHPTIGMLQPPSQVVKTNRDVERKAVLQMEVVYLPIPSAGGASSQGVPSTGVEDASSTRRPVLLSLTEDGVNVRSLPDGMLRFQVCAFLADEEQHCLDAVQHRVVAWALPFWVL